ncbi:MAG: cyclic nucleotide-binding domain-containing protein, partial [Anaerolineales bacterium]|nr:cyclic nucleotide-binding domain-containing protein [Anaerolineales bacterium]
YILDRGEAFIWRMNADGAEQVVRQLELGDWFGINALFLEEISDVILSVAGGSTVLVLSRPGFEQFLEENPDVWDTLQIPESLLQRLEAPQFDWMTDDETTVFYAAKTRWALVGKLILPVALSILFLWLGWKSIGGSIAKAPLLWGLLAFMVGGGWSVLRWLDWRNDYYVVTNKRVVHHESHLPSLKVTVEQAFLHQIQNLTLLKPSPLAQALNYGSLIIETAGRAGSIAFTLLDNPEECQQIIFYWLEKSRSLAQISERAAIREAITQQLAPREPAQTIAMEDVPLVDRLPAEASESEVKSTTSQNKLVSWLEQRLSKFAGRINELLPNFRLEVGQVVTWHKHPFVLVKAIWVPALVLLVTVLISIGWTIAANGQNFSKIALVLFIVCVFESSWFMWRYEDWRNDIFQMTASHILDIDRLPLGLKESRRQASLDQIQNINVDIPNFWARIFNYGNVIIETAGRRGDLMFEWVMRPRTIQAEIFARIEEMRGKLRKEQAKQRRQEMVNWLSVYHEMREKKEI